MKPNILVLGCKNYPAFSSKKVISGGMEVYVWELLKYLKNTYNLSIIAGYSKGDDKSVKVISIPVFGGSALQPISLIFFSFFVVLGLIIKKNKFDLINAQTPLSGLIGYLLNKLFGTPYIVSVHIFASSKEHVGRFAKIYGTFEKIVLKNADKVICAGYKLKEHLISRYNIHQDHFAVIHPGMDLVNNNKVAPSAVLKEKLTDDSSFKVLFLGRLIDENGIKDLLKAMTYLKGRPIKLLIAGNGDLEGFIREYIQMEQLQSKVNLLGIIRGEDKIALLQNVDLVVRTSYHEVFPVAYLEAIAFGIPVIATAIGDTEYLAKKTDAITIVPINDPKKVSESITNLTNKNGLTEETIFKCNEYIAKISWEIQAKKTAEIFNKIISNKKVRRKRDD